MKSIIRENTKRYIADKRKVLLLAVFAFFCGTETGKAQAANMSLFEYVLFIMSNHYYIIYFLLMGYIFFLFDNIREETALMRVRIKTVKNQYICRVSCILIQSAICVAAHFVLAMAIGLAGGACGKRGLPITDGFCATGIDGYYSETIEFILEYSQYMNSPVIACVLTAVYMILGLTFIAVLIYIVDSIWGKKISLIAVGVIILDIMAGFKIGINGVFEALFLNNYFIFHHVLFGSGRICAAINVCIEIVIVCCGMKLLKIKLANNTKRKLFCGSNAYIKEIYALVYKCSALFLGGYILLNIISVLFVRGAGDVQNVIVANKVTDVLFVNVAGYSNNNFYLFDFVKYLVYFMVPVFFIGMITEREKKMFNAQVAVRYGQKKWKAMMEKSINMYLIKYSVIFYVFLGTTAVVLNLNCKNVSSDFDKIHFYTLIIAALVLRLFELIYYKEIYMCINVFVKNSVASFIMTFAGYIVAIILSTALAQKGGFGLIVSYGISALYNYGAAAEGNGMVVSFVVAVICLMIKIIFLRLFTDIIRRKS